MWSAGRPHDQGEKGWEEAASRDAVCWAKRERESLSWSASWILQPLVMF